jgi:hypothetical protein
MIKRSSTHFINGFFKRITANFIKYGAMNNFRSLKDRLEDITFKLKSNIHKNIINLLFRSGNIKIIIIDTI